MMQHDKICLLGSTNHQQYLIANESLSNVITGDDGLQEQIACLVSQNEFSIIITTIAPEYIESILEAEGITSGFEIAPIDMTQPELNTWLLFAGITVDWEDPKSAYQNNQTEKLYRLFLRYYESSKKITKLWSSNEADLIDKHEAASANSNLSMRLYPTGERQDTLVYCQRFFGLHFSSLLSVSTLPTGQPIQDPRLLRHLREDLGVHIQKISIPSLYKVTINKEIKLIDTGVGYSTWVSINQLKALIEIYDANFFELQDAWIFNEYSIEKDSFITDKASWLSVTYGFAISNSIHHHMHKHWRCLYLGCEEKAFWLRLINDMNNKFDITISGYGNGALSFYCWNGELEQVSHYIRKRSAVLKHWDREIEANINEFIEGIYDEHLDFEVVNAETATLEGGDYGRPAH